ILVDAPCSGEGMFKKNEKEALENWSLKNVTACAERQREILSAAAKMLGENADVVYSTCTFAPEEDEEQIENFLREHPEFTLKEPKKLYPHEVRGEGHFYAVLHKNGGEGAAKSPKEAKTNLTAKEKALFSDFCKQNLVDFETENGVLYRAGEYIYLLPAGCFTLEKLPVLRAGLRVAEIVKDRLEPTHALAEALNIRQAQRVVCLDRAACEKYLRGETVQSDVKNGWCLVTIDGYSLGWGKATGGTVKNHYPKGLRIIN
ncbi:MAG: RsmF rRNA methyltransferase first C-terminal domain-containing protein, partial [Clostridia bacterium]|nr:RsmF rRNA methyltransferase first C-terminal domain-containing protein [Clostridia bacterium]